MNKFKYSESANKLLLDIPEPEATGNFDEDATLFNQWDKWNSRLSYSLSPELKAMLTNGQVIREDEFMVIQKPHDSKGCGCERDYNFCPFNPQASEVPDDEKRIPLIAIPLPEQTKPIQEWKDSELAKVTDRMKADLDRLAYLEERVKTLEKYETAALKLAASNWKELQTNKVKDLFTYDQMYEAVNRVNSSDYPIPHATLKLFIKETFGIEIK